MYPANLRYTNEHEWVRAGGDEYTVGITGYAVEQLGDITYVELPKIGVKVKQHGEAATVESVKAASDVYAPVAGEVSAVNGALDASPELVNQNPYEEGWFFKLKGVDKAEFAALMDADAYGKFIGRERSK
jgi:glycine cleavage system H protein